MTVTPVYVSRQDESNVLIELKRAQNEFGHVTLEAMTKIAESTGVSLGDVFGIATFYTFLSVKPVGRNVIRVCKSLPCHMKEAESVIAGLTKTLGIKPGETTPDGRFTLELANCIGACDQAPAMLVNGELHGNMSPERISGILESYK